MHFSPCVWDFGCYSWGRVRLLSQAQTEVPLRGYRDDRDSAAMQQGAGALAKQILHQAFTKASWHNPRCVIFPMTQTVQTLILNK